MATSSSTICSLPLSISANQRRTSALFSSDIAVLPMQSGFWVAPVHYQILLSGIARRAQRERGHWTMADKLSGNGSSIPERLTISETEADAWACDDGCQARCYCRRNAV